ncbi:translocation/assembly module TamB domain-containing protein [uncultured Nonlabens sp.]|uniref:translocation/assembly module TamB domain-containing protein n=1 Tax=uncultured Nonlabens sp. TaxID=859306 RepID=UPI002621D0CB|nr:translocation/assembly module TamB domain-containing protein [uncultured Nonlabens sp.]
MLLVVVFSFPAVQTAVAGRATTYLNEEYNTNIKIEAIDVSFSGDVIIKESRALDSQKDTIFYFKKLTSSILGFNALLSGQPDLGDTSIDGLFFNMKRYKGDSDDNLTELLHKFRKSDGGPSKSPFILTTDDLNITNSRISIVDENLKYPESFIATNFNLQSDGLKIEGSNISAVIEDASFDMYTGVMKPNVNGIKVLKVKSLKADFSYTPSQILATDLVINTAGSMLEGDLKMSYKREDFIDFVNKVSWDFHIKNADLSTNELRKFYNEIIENETVKLKGVLKGPLNDFTVSNMLATTLSDITIDGKMRFKNLIENKDDFFIEGDFNNLQVSNTDLKRFLPNILGKTMPGELNQLGTVKAIGYASVDSNRVITKLSGSTRKGHFNSDLVLNDIQSENIAYKGNIKLDEIQLGSLLHLEEFGTVTLNLDVDGRGFDPEKINTTLRGKVAQLDFNGYSYKNIVINGKFKKPIFKGKVSINDPNVKMNFNGLADLTAAVNTYDFKARIEYADLKAINLFTRDSLSILKGNVIMNMKGTTLDDAIGSIKINDASYKNHNDDYVFEDFAIKSSFKNEERLITINSPDIIEGELSGIFKIAEIPELFKNSLGNVYTNYRSENITEDQYLDYEFKIYDKIVDLVFPEIDLGENTILKGQVASNEAQFRMTFRSPDIKVYGIELDQVNVQINNQNPLFNTFIKIDQVKNDVYDIEDFQLINVTNKDTLLFRTKFNSMARETDKFNLSFYHTVNDSNESVVGIRKSDVIFQGQKWFLNKQDREVKLNFDHNFKTFKLDSLLVKHQEELITIVGHVARKDSKDLHIGFKDVRVSSLTSPIDSLKLKGHIDGDLSLKQFDGKYAPTSDFTVKGLEVNETPLGDFELSVIGNDNLSRFDVNAQLKDDVQKTFTASGYIDASGEASTIDVNAVFKDFNLYALSPLGGEVLDNIRGFTSGQARLTGDVQAPDISGSLKMRDAGLRIPYLNTDFDIENNSKISITSTSFDFNNLQIKDTKYNTRGVLSGAINHKNFGFWDLDLKIESEKLLALDTQLTPDALYYGTAFIDGQATITGPTNELFINVIATTGEGTVFKVPIDDGESLGDTSAIYFLSPEEKKARISGEQVITNKISGLELRFELQVTPDAEVEITVDPTNGSYIRGRGVGNLLLEINTNGKFIMNGDFIVTEGIYNFKYAGIVNKNFTIEPGGTMDWNGDPTNANIDVEAIYITRANPSILLDNPNLNAQVPVEVLTKLQGDLSFFDPEFVIRFPNTNSVVSSELQYRLDDKSQRQLQALSLVATGSFYNPNSIGQNAVTGNVVESVTGIVNDLVSREDSKFDFGVSYEASERNPNSDLERADRFGITLSTQITDRVLINGKLGVPVGSTSSSERAVIGNVEIEFLINEDGTLRLKLFNRENTLQQLGQQEDYTQGLGLQYRIDFDSLKELYERIFKKKMVKAREVKASEEVDSAPIRFK